MSELTTAASAVKKNPTVKDMVEAQLPAIERQLAGVMNSDAFVRAALSEIGKSADLQQAAPATVLGSLMLAAQLKLELGSGLGEFYLTSRKENKDKPNERIVCLPIIGYQGLVKLALRSEFVEKVESFLVREGDAFKHGASSDRGGRYYDWEPADYDDKRQWTHVVATASLRGSALPIFEVLTYDQVMERRPNHWKYTPWANHEEQMARKTAVRALAKYLPKSTDLGKAMEADEAKATFVKGLDEVQVTRVEEPVEVTDVVTADVTEGEAFPND